MSGRTFRIGLCFVVCAANLSSQPLTSYLPDHRLTPGAVRSAVEGEVCSTRRTAHYRGTANVSKWAVLARYGIPSSLSHNFEDDHLIPLELGGSDGIENRWPQPWRGRWGAADKDRLENRLRYLVCQAGGGRHVSLAEAQQAIAADWIQSYLRYVGHRRPYDQGEGIRGRLYDGRVAPFPYRLSRA